MENITENSGTKKSKTWTRESENLFRYRGKKGKGAWYFRGQVNGREVRKRLWATSKTAARQAALDVQRNCRDISGKPVYPIRDYLKRYLEQRTTIKKPETVKKDYWVLNEFAQSYPDFEKIGIHIVTPESLNCWLNDLRVRRIQSGHRFSERTKNIHRLILFKMFKTAMKEGLITGNPVSGVEREKEKLCNKGIPTPSDFQTLLVDLEKRNSEAAAFLKAVGFSGLGTAELLSLTESNLNFETGYIVNIVRKKTSLTFDSKMTRQCISFMRERIEHLKKSKEDEHCLNTPLFKEMNFNEIFSDGCKRCSLLRYSPRSFRKMYISRLYIKGVPVNLIAKWQGHSDQGQLILKTYARFTRESENGQLDNIEI